MKRCEFCGYISKLEAKFCYNCGQQFKAHTGTTEKLDSIIVYDPTLPRFVFIKKRHYPWLLRQQGVIVIRTGWDSNGFAKYKTYYNGKRVAFLD